MKKVTSIGILTVLIINGLVGLLSGFDIAKASGLSLPFEDNFEDGNFDNWNDASDTYGSIRIETGNLDGTGNYYLCMDSPPEPDNQARGILENGNKSDWNNYALELDSKIDYCSGGYAYINVYFYLQSTTDINNGYWLHMRAFQNSITLHKRVNGMSYGLITVPKTIEVGAVYHIKIIVNDGTINYYLDGAKLIEIEDHTFTYGTVGFSTHGAGAETVRSAFDNVRIYSIGGNLPDLSIKSSDISFSNPNPIVGDTIQINTLIHNIGNNFVNSSPLLTNLTEENNPIYTAQNKIIFTQSQSKIFVIDDDGTNLTEITNNLKMGVDSDIQTRAVTKSCQKILFTAKNGGGPTRLYSVDSEGTNFTTIRDDGNDHWECDISPDDAKIVMRRAPYANAYWSEIYIMDIDGSNVTQLTFNATGYSSYQSESPSFSHDGKEIVFHSCKDTGLETNRELYIMNMDGTDQKRLTYTPYQDCAPNFHSDNTKIIYGTNEFGNYDIFIFDRYTKEKKTLMNGSAWQWPYNFNNDGTKFVFTSDQLGNCDIWIASFTATATVSFYDGNPDSGGTLIGQDNIPIWGDATAHASINWNTTPGTHYIYVRIEDVKPGDANESNNVASKLIIVKAPISPVADAGPDQIANEGDIVQFNACKSAWQRLPDMPTGRTAAGAAVFGSELHVFGGYNNSDPSGPYLDVHEVYDIYSNSWRTAAPLPLGRGALEGEQLGGFLYAVGGFIGGKRQTDRYDPITDSWITRASTNYNRPDAGLASLQGKLYVVGGARGGKETMEVYEPTTNKWSLGPNLLYPRGFLDAVALEGKVYAVGGYDVDGTGVIWNTVEAYNPMMNTWNEIAPMSTPRACPAVVTYGGKIYVFGGDDGAGHLTSIEVYDPTADSWSQEICELPQPNGNMVAEAFDGAIYIVGGGNEQQPFNSLYRFFPDLSYSWDFNHLVDSDGDGNTTNDVDATGQKPTHIYGDDGVYTITLKVTNAQGLSDEDTCLITVNNIAPSVNAGPDQTVLSGDTVSFSGSFTDPGWLDTHTYEWNLGDGTVVTDTLTPIHVYYEKGIYSVTLTVIDDDGGVGTDTLEIKVIPIPATIDIDPDTINLGDEGKWITCYIELPEGYDVRDIDASTILLEDSLSPILDPKYGFVKSEDSYITDHDEDGIPERMVKFDRHVVEGMLSPGTYNLKVTGEFTEGTEFEGYSDEIKVIEPP